MVLLNQNVTTNYSYQRNNVSSNFGLVEERLRRSHSKKHVRANKFPTFNV